VYKRQRLDIDAAKQAIDDHIGKPLGLGTMDAAEAIVRVANARMAGAIRLVSIERGHDPKRIAAMPFGGGGSLHAGALMREVGLGAALIPRFPGVTSALGCVIADMRHDFVHTVNAMLDALDVPQIDRWIADFAAEGETLLERAGVAFANRATLVELDMSYAGQTHTVAVPLDVGEDGGPLTGRDPVRKAFERVYRDIYNRLLEGIPIRVLNLRVAVIGRRPKFDLSVLAPQSGSVDDARIGERDVWIDGAWHTGGVFDRLALPVDARIDGPALLEQADTTIFIDPGLSGRVDTFGNIVIRRSSELD